MGTPPVKTRFLVVALSLVLACTGFLGSTQAMKTHDIFKPTVSSLGSNTSLVCGYVTDNETGAGIQNVHIHFRWFDHEGHSGERTMYSDAFGFYSFDTSAVDFSLFMHAPDYISKTTPTMSIGEDTLLWFNVSLTPFPPATVLFQGYVHDQDSGAPLVGANVYVNWQSPEGYSWSNSTLTNSTGYYLVGCIAGTTWVDAYMEDYFSYYSDVYSTTEGDIVWLNISLVPYPLANASVCGYVRDSQTGDPIRNANINVDCETPYGYWDNSTRSDDTGFYSIGVLSGQVGLDCYAINYDSIYSDFVVDENETIWINISLDYNPESPSSQVEGHVVDAVTYGAIRGAFVCYSWKDDVGHFWSDSTCSDQTGHYWFEVPSGFVQIVITGNAYGTVIRPWFEIEQNESFWWNTSLTPTIQVSVLKPLPGLYVFGHRVPILSLLWSQPLVIGPITVQVNVSNASLGCNRVDFYIDGQYVGSDTEYPYAYNWTQRSLRSHLVRVVAYDNAGPCAISSFVARKFL